MCGIVGFNFKNKDLINKMNEALKHRGPDAEGTYVDNNVSLGHRRLSIIDLSEKGRQPMEYKDYLITYNGEIYNYLEIKKELKAKGHTFLSDSDTEVILHSYEEWGSDSVNHFNGMWAFCIYDKKEDRLFISRDRFGIKPVYYYWDGTKFIFASELKAIKKHDLDLKIDKNALNYYFYQKYIGGYLTIYENVFKLKPSCNLFFNIKNKSLYIEEYYSLEDEINKIKSIKLTDRIKKIESLLEDAVKKRLIADVPVGSFLSGGLDSSLISAIIAKDKKDFDTFSIGFKEKSYNELEYSKLVSKKIKTAHHYKYLDIDEDIIKNVVDNMDEPFGDSSILPTYLLSKITREHVTVSLSGDAADEIFGGYDTYVGYKISKFIPYFLVKLGRFFSNLLPVSDKKVTFSFKIKRFLRDFSRNICKRHFNWLSTFNDSARKDLLKDNFVDSSKLINFRIGKEFLDIQLSDVNNYLVEDILKKVDLASMLNSLEARVPFLDHRLVPFVLSLPENKKLRGLSGKCLLKQIATEYIPKKVIYRKKRGFSVPVAKWIKESDFIKNVLLVDEYLKHGFFDKEFLLFLYNEHITNRKDNSRELWLIFVFNYWWKKNRI